MSEEQIRIGTEGNLTYCGNLYPDRDKKKSVFLSFPGSQTEAAMKPYDPLYLAAYLVTAHSGAVCMAAIAYSSTMVFYLPVLINLASLPRCVTISAKDIELLVHQCLNSKLWVVDISTTQSLPFYI